MAGNRFRNRAAGALLLLWASPAAGHRLDEYLQGTILTIGKDRLQAHMVLTPGIAVFPFLITRIDTDGNGVISDAEQRAYAERVLRDLSLDADGHRLTPRLDSVQFPSVSEMKEGSGEIQLEFSAELPRGGRNRALTLENHHQSGISAYLVNSLVPKDPEIRITAQNRNYSQSFYRLEYEQKDAAVTPLAAWRPGPAIWTYALLGAAILRLLFIWRNYVHSTGLSRSIRMK